MLRPWRRQREHRTRPGQFYDNGTPCAAAFCRAYDECPCLDAERETTEDQENPDA